jgi:hypothetical protein
MDVAGRVAMRFTGDVVRGGSHENLTAVRADGEHLWVAGDENAAIDRLVLDSVPNPARAGRQRSFRLADLVQLPGPPDGETDLQGIARSGGWLWAVGSHALVRRRPKPVHDDAKVVRRLGKLRRDPNRFVIVRLAVQLGVDRRPEPVRVARDGRRSALIGAPRAETLVDLLRSDAHLAPFLTIPGQDNGFDVGGLAVVGDRLYVGLRGPVLRGWAVVLELRPAQDPTDPGRLALGIFPEGARYRKHVLDLGGLGVRDLCPDGDDLLVLAGPTMALSGPVRVHRWRNAMVDGGGPVVRDAELTAGTALAHGEGVDLPSAISLLGPDPLDPDSRLLVVYDSPAADRRPWSDTVLADVVRIGADDVDGSAPDVADSVDAVPVDRDPGAGLAPVDLAVVDTVPADPEPADAFPLDDEPDDDLDPVDDAAYADAAVPDQPREPTASDGPPADDPARDDPRDGHLPADHRPATVLLPEGVRRIGS